MLSGKFDVKRLVVDIKKGEATTTEMKYARDEHGTPHWKYEGYRAHMTKLYSLRAALRGKLHMSRIDRWNVAFNQVGDLERIESKKGDRFVWTKDVQEDYIKDLAEAYRIEEDPAPIV